jgi:hypothetical protein
MSADIYQFMFGGSAPATTENSSGFSRLADRRGRRNRVTSAVASAQILVITTLETSADGWTFVPAASADFMLGDSSQPALLDMFDYVHDFLDTQGVSQLFVREPSTGPKQQARASSHKLVALLQLGAAVSVELIHFNSIIAWHKREAPELPVLKDLRHGAHIPGRRAFDLYERAIATAAYADTVMRGGGNG